jgi:hypothetical protein
VSSAAVNALQAIFKDWNQSTPSVSTNLPGWLINYNQIAYPCFSDAWKGVLCVQYPTNSTNIMSIVVGL